MKTMDEVAVWTRVEEMAVASIRYTGRYDQIGPYYAKLYRLYGRWVIGSPMALFHDEEYREDNADIEACVCLRAGANPSAKEGAAIKLVPAQRVAQILHRGGYDELGASYQKVFDFLNSNGVKAATPSREVFVKGPGMIFPRSPKRFLTLIQVPVEG